jgi:hypothetical protein
MTAVGKPEPWQQLYRYWLSKNIDGRPPERADLDPMIEIPHLVAHLMIMDIVPDGFRYRLAGSHVGIRIGEELTGSQVGRNTAAESQWFDLLNTVKQEAKPMIVTSDIPSSAQKRMGVVLPLVDRSGKTEQILAGVFFGNEFAPGIKIGTLAVQELLSEQASG